MKVLTYLKEKNLAPKGGPNAVGYYIYLNSKNDTSLKMDFLPGEDVYKENKLKKFVKKLPNWILNIGRKHKRLSFAKNILKTKHNYNIDFNQYDIIHFHTTLDLYSARDLLKTYNGKIILTSHSPVPTWKEYIADLSDNEVNKYKKIYDNFKVIDEYAFDRADYITFPCPEAEEPYFDFWDKYAKIHSRNAHKYLYILTGIPAGKSTKSKQDVISSLNLSNNSFLVSYVGRHNVVKGYKDLKEIGQNVINADPNIHFIIAGKEYPLTGLQHPHWHEIGWTNDPHSIISASDVFILPNKATYFDIVMLEVLSLGKIVIASRTGGNKYFEKIKMPGVLLYNTIEDATKLIFNIKQMDTDKRNELEQSNKIFFENNFTDKIFYQNYKNLLSKILEENN